MSNILAFDVTALSDSELEQVQEFIQKEQQRRYNIRYTVALCDWAQKSEDRHVKVVSHKTSIGWISILVVFLGSKYQSFKAIAQTEEQSKEDVSKMAVMNSTLVLDGIPEELKDDPMEITE